ncbi:Acetyltransferase (GNAT) family protein [Marinibacterium anthonyi]|nr:Acetyltransferase (GNAT) family protein [Marinibacterium anthonyi]
MTPQRVIAAVDGTWPAARVFQTGAWTLREGQGGGQRVSAATALAKASAADLPVAEEAMREMGQRPLFMIRPCDQTLDALLEARGYAIHDPVRAWVCPPQTLMDQPVPRVTVFAIWEPLAMMREIWEAGGIGPGRQAVMDRAQGPKTALLGRWKEKPAAAAFVAIHDGVAMLHALEVLPHQRRQGMAQWMMRAAAFWAAENGADTLAVLCTQANGPANGLYASLSMKPVTEYHYRHKPEETASS